MNDEYGEGRECWRGSRGRGLGRGEDHCAPQPYTSRLQLYKTADRHSNIGCEGVVVEMERWSEWVGGGERPPHKGDKVCVWGGL